MLVTILDLVEQRLILLAIVEARESGKVLMQMIPLEFMLKLFNAFSVHQKPLIKH